MGPGLRFVGIDLGAHALHVVTLTEEGPRLAVRDARVLTPDSIDELPDLAAGAAAIAIDAPAGPSRGCHVTDTTLAPKFRTARCGEIALGQRARIWVPWPTPRTQDDTPPWMRVGFAAWDACRRTGPVPLEVYPAGAFRVLAGGKIAPKSTPAGLRARRRLLATAVAPPVGFAMWSHDGIDATVAALTAAHHVRGIATGYGHTDPDCDGSALWLPAGPADAEAEDPAG